MRLHHIRVLEAALLFLFALPLHNLSCAANVNSHFLDSTNQPVADAVISLTPLDAKTSLVVSDQRKAVMDQWGKQFTTYVLPVEVGTVVTFPNRDNIKHHVYSFSPAKRFELKLYSSGNLRPILFDKPGIVVLGCNIHDWMLAYIDVLDTPYFAKSDAQGFAHIDHVPDGSYRIEIWHPQLIGSPDGFAKEATLKGNQVVDLHYAVPLKRAPRRSPPPYYDNGEY